MDLCEFWKNNTQGPYKYIYLADSIKVALGIGNVCLDFIQGACTESLDGQVQGTTTDPSHKNYIWDPSGLFSIISHMSLWMP